MLLICLYALAIAVLIGAALNAAIRVLWPVEERRSLRAQVGEWARRGWLPARRQGAQGWAWRGGPGGNNGGCDATAGATGEDLVCGPAAGRAGRWRSGGGRRAAYDRAG